LCPARLACVAGATARVVAPASRSTTSAQAPATATATSTRRASPPSDVEADSGSDSDVIVTGYVAPRRDVIISRELTDDGRKRDHEKTTATRTASANEPSVRIEEVTTQPVKRRRGRPRKHPLPTDGATTNSDVSSRSRSAVVALNSSYLFIYYSLFLLFCPRYSIPWAGIVNQEKTMSGMVTVRTRKLGASLPDKPH